MTLRGEKEQLEKNSQKLGLKNEDLNQNFLEIICVEEVVWVCPSFSDSESAALPDKFCVSSGCFIFELISSKHELPIPKQKNDWFI